MIYQIGEEVVCMDDEFQPWVFELYRKLPIKGETYTLRNISIGRADINDREVDSLVLSFLLEEIENPIDPYYKAGKEELRFDSRHFMTLKEFKERVDAPL